MKRHHWMKRYIRSRIMSPELGVKESYSDEKEFERCHANEERVKKLQIDVQRHPEELDERTY